MSNVQKQLVLQRNNLVLRFSKSLYFASWLALQFLLFGLLSKRRLLQPSNFKYSLSLPLRQGALNTMFHKFVYRQPMVENVFRNDGQIELNIFPNLACQELKPLIAFFPWLQWTCKCTSSNWKDNFNYINLVDCISFIWYNFQKKTFSKTLQTKLVHDYALCFATLHRSGSLTLNFGMPIF